MMANTSGKAPAEVARIINRRLSNKSAMCVEPTEAERRALETLVVWRKRNDAKLQAEFDVCASREFSLARAENREPRPMLVWMYDDRVTG
jgi:hypothetical protein